MTPSSEAAPRAKSLDSYRNDNETMRAPGFMSKDEATPKILHDGALIDWSYQTDCPA